MVSAFYRGQAKGRAINMVMQRLHAWVTRLREIGSIFGGPHAYLVLAQRLPKQAASAQPPCANAPSRHTHEIGGQSARPGAME